MKHPILEAFREYNKAVENSIAANDARVAASGKHREACCACNVAEQAFKEATKKLYDLLTIGTEYVTPDGYRIKTEGYGMFTITPPPVVLTEED